MHHKATWIPLVLERQNTRIFNMKIGFRLITFISLMLVLVSCTKDIPEGDIKNFVENINYDASYDFVETAKATTTVEYYVNKELKGEIVSYTEISKDNLYSYSKNQVSGSYYGNEVGQYNFNEREVLAYLESEEMPRAYEKIDGTITEDFKYSPEDVNLSFNNYFYTELEAGYHRGGYYYGDYIHANCGRYYDYFSLSDDKKTLTYSINLLSDGPEGEDILTLHSFTVNEYGLIIELSSTVKNNEKGIVSTTTMSCEYNVDLDVKATL